MAGTISPPPHQQTRARQRLRRSLSRDSGECTLKKIHLSRAPPPALQSMYFPVLEGLHKNMRGIRPCRLSGGQKGLWESKKGPELPPAHRPSFRFQQIFACTLSAQESQPGLEKSTR